MEVIKYLLTCLLVTFHGIQSLILIDTDHQRLILKIWQLICD